MSQLFGANMYSIQHLITAGMEPAHYQTMLHYVMDQIPDVDFFDCRVSTADKNAIQALENAGFRFVGNEVYMARSLVQSPVPKEYGQTDCIPCPYELQTEVLELAKKTHFHNRYMYDPEVRHQDAVNVYRKYLADLGFKKEFRTMIMRNGQKLLGFIFYKYNNVLSQIVGNKYASLDFIAVNPEAQNSGVGEALNKAALFDLVRSSATHVVVRTFGSNYPAIRICQKVGFKITSSDLHFHLWVRPRAQAKHRLQFIVFTGNRPSLASTKFII